jgi:type IV pilus assembly protein PilM
MFNKKILSIDIGSKYIKLVEGYYQGKKVVVDKAEIIETPENCYDDGKIVNMIVMKEEILKALKNMKCKARHVVCSTKSTSVINRIIEVPQVKEKEIGSLVEFEIKQYLPIDFEDYIIDYRKISEFEVKGVKKFRIAVGVYPKTIAKGYWDLIRELKLIPLALDLSSNCINKLFSEDGEINFEDYSSKETVAVIDIGYEQIELDIISEGILEFTRILQGGGSYIDASIGSQMFIERNEGEKKKIELCDLRDNKEKTNFEEDMINDAAKLVINRWHEQINRMFDYFKSKERDKHLSRIYIYGGTSELKGIEDYLSSVFDMPVSIIEYMDNIQVKDLAKDIKINRYLNAIGAIIRFK